MTVWLIQLKNLWLKYKNTLSTIIFIPRIIEIENVSFFTIVTECSSIFLIEYLVMAHYIWCIYHYILNYLLFYQN